MFVQKLVMLFHLLCCQYFKLRRFQILQRSDANKGHCDGWSWDNKWNTTVVRVLESFTACSTSSHRLDACQTWIVHGQVKRACFTCIFTSVTVHNTLRRASNACTIQACTRMETITTYPRNQIFHLWRRLKKIIFL